MYETEVRVGFPDTDCTTRVYFNVYIKWLDNAIIEMFREHGITYGQFGDMRFRGERLEVTFVIGEYRCRIEKPSILDDILKLRVWVSEVRDKVVVHQGIFYNSNGEVAARAEITYVCINTNTGKSDNIPEDIRRELQAMGSST